MCSVISLTNPTGFDGSNKLSFSKNFNTFKYSIFSIGINEKSSFNDFVSLPHFTYTPYLPFFINKS